MLETGHLTLCKTITDFPSISVITPSYNQRPFIEETIKSVLSQEGDFFIDYIIVDGSSDDNSIEIIQKYDTLIKNGIWSVKCRGIRYRWLSKKDKGQSEAVNKGLAMSEGAILAWLNSDDTYYPGALADAAHAIDPAKGILIALGKCSFIDEDGHSIGKEHPSAFVSHQRLAKIWKGHTIPQPAVFFHRTVFEKCGGLDETLYFAPDYDLFLRFTLHFDIAVIDHLWATYRIHPSSKTTEISQGELLEKSLEISRRYWGPVSSLSYWKYFFSYWLYGGRLGVISIKRLNIAERLLHQKEFTGFLWNLLLSLMLFPPTIVRYLLLPRLIRQRGKPLSS